VIGIRSHAQHLEAERGSHAIDRTFLAALAQNTVIAEELPTAHWPGHNLVHRVRPKSDPGQSPQPALLDPFKTVSG
jgi:hypothetical protein